MEREAFIVSMDQKVRSVKCHYPKWEPPAKTDVAAVSDAAVSDVAVKREDSPEEDDYKLVSAQEKTRIHMVLEADTLQR